MSAGDLGDPPAAVPPETVGIYRDTIGDEALGLSGATLAGVLTALFAARQRSAAHRDPATSEL
jgi:hypothetical protein